MINDLARGARDADIVLAALDQTRVPFQVGGDLALAQHKALKRRAIEISLTTPITHDTDRSREVVQGALENLGYRVLAEQASGQQGLFRAMNYLPPDRAPDDPNSVPVRLSIAVKPQYNAPVERAGLRVSSMTTLSVHALQAVQSRLDPRDFIDLTAHDQHWGQQAFGKLTDQVLQQAVKDQSPRLDPAEPYRRLRGALMYVQHITNHQFTWLGVPVGQVEGIRTAIKAMAERVWSSRPRPRPVAGHVDAALDQLKGLSPEQLASLPDRLAQPGARAALAARFPSPVPPPPPYPPSVIQPAAADSQRQHQQDGSVQNGRHPR